MSTFDRLGLCGGSLAGAGFREIVECAGAAGFRYVTLWPSHFDDALASGLSEADLRRILADNGVAVSELDPLCSWLPTPRDPDHIAAPFFRYREADFFRIADALGARSLNVIQASDEPIERGRLVDTLASLGERAARHGLVVSLEFMPWSPIGDLATALAIVSATGRADCGVNVDTWHHFRSGGTAAELAALSPERVAAIQLSDVEAEPWAEPLEETARARRLPGDGAGRAAEAMAAFGAAGVDVPITLEVFSDALRQMAPTKAVELLAQSGRRVLEASGSAPGTLAGRIRPRP